jgi:PAS domain S-box-containing protein
MLNMIRIDDQPTIETVYGCSSYSGQVPPTTTRPVQERKAAQRKFPQWFRYAHSPPSEFKLHPVLASLQLSQMTRNLCRHVRIFLSLLHCRHQTFHEQLPATFLQQSKKRCLEQQVAEHAAQLETIFESIADAVVVTDRQGRVLQVNQAVRTLLGLEQDSVGWTISQLEELAGFVRYTAAGQHLSADEDPVARVLQGEVLTNEQSVDTLIQTRAGRTSLVNTTGAPIRDATGQLLGSVLVIRDVTEQRRLESHTHMALNALLAMAEALVQSPGEIREPPCPGARRASSEEEGDFAPTVMARRLAELTRCLLGFQYVSIVAVEPTTERLTPITGVGFTPEQERQWWASWEGPFSLGERLDPFLAARLRSGKSGLIERSEQSQRWHPLFAHVTSLLVPMRIGETLVGVLRLEDNAPNLDSTRRHETAVIEAVARLGALVLERERLLREREEARASELAVRETQTQMEIFLGIAGHELKTPLTSLKLALQLGERRLQRLVEAKPGRAEDLAPFQEQVAQVAHQAIRLDRLVNDLLDVSRARAGRLDLHLEPADLAAIVGEAVEQQRQANPARTLTFQFSADRRVLITADADRIGQVVTNYLTNALKFSAEECPVAVGMDLEAEQARVWVRDQGPGLPADEQERIWECFHRVKGIEVLSGSGVGLGLGLHICRMIIERHQGQVGIQSAPGQGSTLWFSLPLGDSSRAFRVGP